jgi:phosphohistidine phosphatase
MRLYLVQHGKPLPKEENPDKPLSDKGKKDVNHLAEFLERAGVRVDMAFHSGKSRAEETASILVSRIGQGLKAEQREGLSPLDDIKGIVDTVLKEEKDFLVVGHLPHLGKLASYLVAGDDSLPVVTFQQGGMVCLERGEEGNWTVVWMLIPGIL